MARFDATYRPENCIGANIDGASRWKIIAACEAARHLLTLPLVNPERNKLRDVVRVTGDALDRRAHKYLTLAAEYNARKRNPLHDPIPTYADWLRTFLKPADVRAEYARQGFDWSKA